MSWEFWFCLVVGVSLVGWIIMRWAFLYFIMGGNSGVNHYEEREK